MNRLAGPWRALPEGVVAAYRAALGDDLVAVAVFGSVARGTAGPASDLDLYVVTRPQEPVALDPRLSERWRVCETPEYVRLAREGYRPDPRPVFHTVEQLKSHPRIPPAVNVAGTTHVAPAAAKHGATLVYDSTDYVFDGKSGPYAEDDVPNPISVYGRTKLEAEQAVLKLAPRHLIVVWVSKPTARGV